MLPTIPFLTKVPWKLVGVGVLAIVVAGSVYAFWRHYSALVETNAELSNQVGELETSVKTQSATIGQLEQDLTDWEEAQARHEAQLQEIRDGQIRARAETQRLLDIFSEHDLQALLERKPETVLRLVNDGTDRAGRMLECASGAGGDDCPGADDQADEAGPR